MCATRTTCPPSSTTRSKAQRKKMKSPLMQIAISAVVVEKVWFVKTEQTRVTSKMVSFCSFPDFLRFYWSFRCCTSQFRSSWLYLPLSLRYDFGVILVLKETRGPPRDLTGELYHFRLGLMLIVPKKYCLVERNCFIFVSRGEFELFRIPVSFFKRYWLIVSVHP